MAATTTQSPLPVPVEEVPPAAPVCRPIPGPPTPPPSSPRTAARLARCSQVAETPQPPPAETAATESAAAPPATPGAAAAIVVLDDAPDKGGDVEVLEGPPPPQQPPANDISDDDDDIRELEPRPRAAVLAGYRGQLQTHGVPSPAQFSATLRVCALQNPGGGWPPAASRGPHASSDHTGRRRQRDRGRARAPPHGRPAAGRLPPAAAPPRPPGRGPRGRARGPARHPGRGRAPPATVNRTTYLLGLDLPSGTPRLVAPCRLVHTAGAATPKKRAVRRGTPPATSPAPPTTDAASSSSSSSSHDAGPAPAPTPAPARRRPTTGTAPARKRARAGPTTPPPPPPAEVFARHVRRERARGGLYGMDDEVLDRCLSTLRQGLASLGVTGDAALARALQAAPRGAPDAPPSPRCSPRRRRRRPAGCRPRPPDPVPVPNSTDRAPCSRRLWSHHHSPSSASYPPTTEPL